MVVPTRGPLPPLALALVLLVSSPAVTATVSIEAACALLPTPVEPLCPPPAVDTRVDNGESHRYHNGTFVMRESMTIGNGGRVAFDNATLLFEETAPSIFVDWGGRLDVRSTRILPKTGDERLRITAWGGNDELTIATSLLRQVDVESNVEFARIEENRFERAGTALNLDRWPTVRGNVINDSTTGVYLSGAGTVQLIENTYEDTRMGIHAVGAAGAMLTDETCIRCEGGIRLEYSYLQATRLAMGDKEDPWSFGAALLSGSALTISDSHFHDWGTAIFVGTGSTLNGAGNTFSNNDQDVVYE